MQPVSLSSKEQVEAFLAQPSNTLQEVRSISISLQNQVDVVRILSACPNISSLFLVQCPLSDTALDELNGKCSHVNSLTLFRLETISDVGMGHLSRWKNLRKVKVCNLPLVSEKGLQTLLKSSSVRKITIFLAYRLNGYALRSLTSKASMPPQITFIGNEVTNELVQEILERNPNIERLAIRYGKVSVQFLEHAIANARKNKVSLSLKKLKCTNTAIKEADMPLLQRLLPNTEVVIR